VQITKTKKLNIARPNMLIRDNTFLLPRALIVSCLSEDERKDAGFVGRCSGNCHAYFGSCKRHRFTEKIPLPKEYLVSLIN
jgi:hypothetical protein